MTDDTSVVNIWKLIANLNLCQTYSQRVNSAFECLSRGAPVFARNDMLEIGEYIFFSYLGLDISVVSGGRTDKLMNDAFNYFDVASSEAVNLSTFVVGIVELLLQLSLNSRKLKEIVAELMPREGSRSTIELLNIIETSEAPAGFRSNFQSFSYVLKDLLMQKETLSLESLTSEMVSGLFKTVLLTIVTEIKQYFHLSNERLYNMICEFSGSPMSVTAVFLKTTLVANGFDKFKVVTFAGVPKAKVSGGIKSFYKEGKFLSKIHKLSFNKPEDLNEGMLESGPRSFGKPKGSRHRDSGFGGGNRSEFMAKRSLSTKLVIEPELNSAMNFLHKIGFNSTKTAAPIPLTSTLMNDDENDENVDNDKLNGITKRTLSDLLELNSADLDTAEVFSLQNAYRALTGFLDLTVGVRPDAITNDFRPPAQVVGKELPTKRSNLPVKTLFMNNSTQEFKSLLDGTSGEISDQLDDENKKSVTAELHLARELAAVQDSLKRLSVRYEMLESFQNSTLLTNKNFDEEMKPIPAKDILKQMLSGQFKASNNVPFTSDTTYQTIVEEINNIKGLISKKTSSTSTTGVLLEIPSAIIPFSMQNDVKSDDSSESTIKLYDLISKLVLHSKELQENLEETDITKETNKKMGFEMKMQEQRIEELNSIIEANIHERNEYLAASVELQMLRDEVKIYRDNGNTILALQLQNHELQRQIQDIRQNLTISDRKCRELLLQLPKADAAAIEEMKKQKSLDEELYDKEKGKLSKEVQRLGISLKQSEQRTKSALQDQLILRQKLSKSEDELSAAKALVTKLLGDIEIEKKQRADRDELDQKVQELQRALAGRDTQLEAAKETHLATKKIREELLRSEAYGASLEEKLGELTAESEKGKVAIEHLDSYREQLRQKTIEARDMSLQLHFLEGELKEVKQFQVKHKLMEQELQDLRIKIEKFPPLLAEVSRLRSSAKAISKTLLEQDKTVATMKEKLKAAESESIKLKAEVRSLHDVENKLKDANAEVKRLQALVGEVNALRVNAKNAEEEKKSIEDQYKKMRRYMRQSVTVATAFRDGAPPSEDSVPTQAPSISPSPIPGAIALPGLSPKISLFSTVADDNDDVNSDIDN